MPVQKRFTTLLTIGLLLLITPFVVRFLMPPAPELEPHTAEYFPVQDPATGKWGFIDNKGRMLTPMVFDWAGDFRQGLGLAESNGAMGFIDATFKESGKWAISPRFELYNDGDQSAFGFFDGLALARDDEGKWGYIDRTGKWAITPRFNESEEYTGIPAGSFSEGLAWYQAIEISERNMLNANGEILRDAENKPMKEPFRRRLMGFIDRDGEIAIAPRFEMVQDFGEGMAGARFKTNDMWGFIDRAGKRVISPAYDGVGRFSEGLCAVQVEGLWGYINPSGKWVIEPRFAEAKQFLEGLAAVRESGKWGYIDPKGNWAIEPSYDNFEDYAHPGDATPFENGLARVTLNGRVIYIDTSGHQVWPSE